MGLADPKHRQHQTSIDRGQPLKDYYGDCHEQTKHTDIRTHTHIK
jgi:hypothetical protein